MKKLLNNKLFIIIAIIVLLLIIVGIAFHIIKKTSTEKAIIKIINNLYIEDDESYTVTKLKEAKKINMKKSFDENNLKEIYSENNIDEKTNVYLIDVLTEEDDRFVAIVSEDGKILDKTDPDTADEEYDNLVFTKDKIDVDKINKKIN